MKIFFRKSSRGVTIIEMIMAVAVFSVIMPLVTLFLTRIVSGFSFYEMSSQLRKINQETHNRIHMRLGTCKRLFQNNTNDNTFLSAVQLTDCPSVLTGSVLPVIEETGSLVRSNPNFKQSSVGNSIFFAGNNETLVLANVLDSSSTLTTVRIDTYCFYYYYLTPDGAKIVGNKETYKLVEWGSIVYADYNHIAGISDSTLKQNTITAIYNTGIHYAWEPSQTNLSLAFYDVNSGGTVSLIGSPSILKSQYKILTDIITGIMGSNYAYGYSPNSSGLSNPPKTVPIYGTESGEFPSGFEVIIVSQAAGRKVLFRSVLVAKESMRNVMGEELTHITSVRDLW
ncbi:MAG: prepilin-type N-terminal cleavage/methylation domain-containing protein [Endomicrobiales bacterium]|nr:prepilin-type N-terminal cleavage/methylation domain-containing protein [Endomicrobiales bacterium]